MRHGNVSGEPSNFGYALLNCPRVLSGLMSITGWRAHFTRREAAWPRESTPLMWEFAELFA